VTVAASSSPSIFDQTKATKRFFLPNGLFEGDVIGDEPVQELLVAAGLGFPEGLGYERSEDCCENCFSPAAMSLSQEHEKEDR
jgi:hypothetical protein